MAGIIVQDLGGGDAAFTFVNHVLWAQICAVRESDTQDPWAIIGWLVTPDSAVPKDAPTREGRIIGTWFTQAGVIELIDLLGSHNICGILVLP